MCKRRAVIIAPLENLVSACWKTKTSFEFGSPNNGNLINHMGSDFPYSSSEKYIIFDSPAGNEPPEALFHPLRRNSCQHLWEMRTFSLLHYLDELKTLFNRRKAIWKVPRHQLFSCRTWWIAGTSLMSRTIFLLTEFSSVNHLLRADLSAPFKRPKTIPA